MKSSLNKSTESGKKGNMQKHPYELQVLVGGHPVKEYAHQGRVFIEGRKGSPFTLRFRNSALNRVLVVPSVDGISVIDGQPATAESRGYIVPGYCATEIKGWRKDLGTVADFVFTERAKSYAAQGPGGQNLGVIAVKIFLEKPQPIIVPTYMLRSVSMCMGSVPVTTTTGEPTYGVHSTGQAQTLGASQPEVQVTASNSTAPAFNLGTGWGAEKADVVSEASFDRGLEWATIEIFYDDADGLRGHGVPLTKDINISAATFPVAFGGFCKPPTVVV